jgi:hypothetical protein
LPKKAIPKIAIISMICFFPLKVPILMVILIATVMLVVIIIIVIMVIAVDNQCKKN